MTQNPSCEELRDDLIALLYDDGDRAEKTRARDHIALCVPCRAEYSDLKGVRKTLGGWTLPVTAAVSQTPRVSPLRYFPIGLAAAAGLILGLGVALTGRDTFFPAADAPVAIASTPDAPAIRNTNANFVSRDELQDLLKSQEERHQNEIAELRQVLVAAATTASEAPRVNRVATSNMTPAAFEALLRASEARQARIFEARLAGLRNEGELQRQYDMAQIAAGLAYIDSRTGADAARTSELMKNLVRVTAKPQDR